MKELHSRLSEEFPRLAIGVHEGTPKHQNIRERFAPDAHKVKVRKKDRIDILISTDSISEGIDLQDANMAIS